MFSIVFFFFAYIVQKVLSSVHKGVTRSVFDFGVFHQRQPRQILTGRFISLLSPPLSGYHGNPIMTILPTCFFAKNEPVLLLQPDVPDADFTIYVDAPTTKTDKSTRDPIADGNEVAAVTLKTDKATTETDTQGKENVPPSSSCLILQPKDNKQNNTIPIEKPNKSSTKTTKKQPYKKQQQLQQTPVLDATMLKRKRRQNLDGSAGTTTKRASLRMMR